MDKTIPLSENYYRNSATTLSFLRQNQWQMVPETAQVLGTLRDMAVKKLREANAAEPGSMQWARAILHYPVFSQNTPLDYLPLLDEDPELFIPEKNKVFQQAKQILGDEAEVSAEDVIKEITQAGLVVWWKECQPSKNFNPPEVNIQRASPLVN